MLSEGWTEDFSGDWSSGNSGNSITVTQQQLLDVDMMDVDRSCDIYCQIENLCDWPRGGLHCIYTVYRQLGQTTDEWGRGGHSYSLPRFHWMSELNKKQK